jgi:hypothetical protein
MAEQNIVNTILDKITKYPQIIFEQNSENEFRIFANSESGFDIILELAARENTLHFGTFHWHFSNDPEDINSMLNMIAMALTGHARIKEFSKNGNAYKWTVQVQDEAGQWHDNGTMGLFNFNFWTKPDVRYLRNTFVSSSEFYAAN